MLINLDHIKYYDYITNATVTMQVDSSTYQLADGDPGASGPTTATFATGR
jgi:hypothetical protein